MTGDIPLHDAVTASISAIKAEKEALSGSTYLFQRGVACGLEAAANAVEAAMARADEAMAPRLRKAGP